MGDPLCPVIIARRRVSCFVAQIGDIGRDTKVWKLLQGWVCMPRENGKVGKAQGKMIEEQGMPREMDAEPSKL